nr:LOW QUALITY PROTEIN: 39S ribosomal protein L15, mitochondrial-like [Equus asinus]
MHMDKDDHPVMTPGMEREEAGSPGGYPLGEPLEAPGGLPGQTPPASQPDARLPFLRLTPSAFRFPLGEGWDFRFHLRKTTSRRSQSEGPAGAIPSANGLSHSPRRGQRRHCLLRIADCSVCSARLLWRKRTPDVQARAQATISQTMKTSAANLPKKKKAEQHRHVNLLKLPKPLPESRALARSRHCDRGGAAAVKQRPRPRGSRARDLLRTLPRVSLANLKPNPGSRKLERRPRGRRRGRRCGRGTDKGERQRGTRPRLGFEGGQTPFYIRIPKYGFNEGHSFRRQYQPLSLNRLQYLIDLGRVDPTQPIDLTQLVNGRGVTIQPYKRDYGVQLVEEGADTFKAKVNIEVQLASELAIAAIEESGGVVTTTAFCDPRSLEILCKPVPFFLRGQPIPKRMLPPEALVPYYTDAKNRGDLADPAKFPEGRLELAQKYGYILPDVTKDELFKVLTTRKDPRQIFFGLAPGRVVNMADKKILKPTEENVLKYYSS